MTGSDKGFGTVRVGRWRNVVGAGVLPVAWNALLWPAMLFQVPLATVAAEPLQALWYLLPLVGVWFLLWWGREVVRVARWGPFRFELTGDRPHPGGRLRGHVVTGAKGGGQNRPSCTVSLRCVARRDRVGRSRKEVERVLAEVNEVVAMEQAVTAAGRQVRIPVDFGLPANAATSTAVNERGERIWWEVQARCDEVRPALHAVIRIPVVHVAGVAGADGADGVAGVAGAAGAAGVAGVAGVAGEVEAPLPTGESNQAAGGVGSPGDANHLITTDARQLYGELEQLRSEADPRGVFSRLLRSRRQGEHHGVTSGGDSVVVQLRGDTGARRAWSLILLLPAAGAVASGVILALPVVLVVALIVRGALRPVMVRVAVQPDHLVCDRLRGGKVRRREWAWSDISTCQTMVGVQFLSLHGLVTRWDLMVQAGMRSGMVGLRMEDDEAINALAGQINRRTGG